LEEIWKTENFILLHDSAHPHTTYLMKVILAAVGWEIMNHAPYSPNLAPPPHDFHLCGTIKVHLEGQKCCWPNTRRRRRRDVVS
jgi:hypothetical protein